MSLADRTLAFAAQAMELQTRKALGTSLLGLVEPLGATTYACLYLRRERGVVVIDRSLSNVSRSNTTSALPVAGAAVSQTRTVWSSPVE